MGGCRERHREAGRKGAVGGWGGALLNDPTTFDIVPFVALSGTSNTQEFVR